MSSVLNDHGELAPSRLGALISLRRACAFEFQLSIATPATGRQPEKSWQFRIRGGQFGATAIGGHEQFVMRAKRLGTGQDLALASGGPDSIHFHRLPCLIRAGGQLSRAGISSANVAGARHIGRVAQPNGRSIRCADQGA